MSEAEYQRFKKRVWRLTGQGDATVDALYEKMLDEEAKGKTGDEIVADIWEELRALAKRFAPIVRHVVGEVERQSGMTFDDFLWLRDYDPPDLRGE